MTETEKRELIEQAHQAIGLNQPDKDWKLSPRSHAMALPESGFSALKNVLNTKYILQLMAEYDRDNARAGKEQKRYKWREKSRIWLFFLALVIGALTLLPLDATFGAGTKTAATAVQFLAISVAFLLTLDNLVFNHHKAWKLARADAEIGRARLFREVLHADPDPSLTKWPIDTASDFPLALQKLEYVRRNHVELQYNYYLGRGEQHLKSDRQRLRWISLTAVITMLSIIPLALIGPRLAYDYWGALGGVQEFLKSLPAWTDLKTEAVRNFYLFFGIFIAGFEATITNIYRLNDDMKNSLEYHHTARKLAGLYVKHLVRLEGKAANGEIDPVIRWFQCCNNHILDEHKKWNTAHAAKMEPLPSLEKLAKDIDRP